MKNKFLITALLLSMFSCQKDEDFNYPLIYTGDVTDISNKGAVFNAKIIDLGRENIIEYGFVWDSRKNPIVETAEKFVIREAPKTGTISEYISTTLRNGVTYYARAFVRNSNYITYGKEVSFTSLGSLGPQITDFNPKSGDLNDTIFIQGKNFSYIPANNKVHFGNFFASVIKANQDTLVVIVPDKLNIQSSELTVSISNNVTIAPAKFQLIKPVISGFSPKSAPFGSIVTIVGSNFNTKKNGLSVSFDNFKAAIKNITNNQIDVYVPLIKLNLEKCHIHVSMNNLADSTIDYFTFVLPQLNDFNPKTGNINDTVTIHGKNFSPLISDNIVMIGELQATVIKANPDMLLIIVPAKLNIQSSELSVSIGNNVIIAPAKFQLIKPVISDFNPKSAPFGSTVTIVGDNFNSKNIQSVYFDNFKATIKNIINNQIEVSIPLELNIEKCHIKVNMNNMTDSTIGYFSILLPVINDFNPKVSTFGSSIQIDGSFLDSNKEHTLVYVDKFEAEIIEISSSKMIIKMPDSINIKQSSLSLKINGMEVLANEKLTIETLELTDFSPQKPLTGGTFTISGKNFSPITSNNIVMIGNVKGKVINSSINSITVELPKQDNVIYTGRELIVSVEVLNEKKSFSNYITINDKWFRHKNSPVDFSDSFYTVVNDKVYFGLNAEKSFWECNPVTDEFKKLTDFPGKARVGGNGFAINRVIYFGTGNYLDNSNFTNLKDFWEYNTELNSWIQKSDFSGIGRTGSIAFSVNGNGYLGGGKYEVTIGYNEPFEDFWKYNPSEDTWSRIPSFNGIDSNTYKGMANGISVVVGDKAYIGLGWNFTAWPEDQSERWFMYNSLTNTWGQLTSFPEPRGSQVAIAFNLAGVPYVKTNASDFYSYNSSDNSWEKVVTDLLPNSVPGIGFSIGNLAYIGIGKVFWEYDPSR